MTSNASAKDEILARIRNANRGESTAQMAASDWESIPRTYVSAPKMAPKDVVELLIDRLRDYDAAVETVSLRDVPAAIVRVLASRGNPSVLVPPGFPADLLADGDFTTDKNVFQHRTRPFRRYYHHGDAGDRGNRNYRVAECSRPGSARGHPGSRLSPLRSQGIGHRRERPGSRTPPCFHGPPADHVHLPARQPQLT